jgi:hypothetical protein
MFYTGIMILIFDTYSKVFQTAITITWVYSTLNNEPATTRSKGSNTRQWQTTPRETKQEQPISAPRHQGEVRECEVAIK